MDIQVTGVVLKPFQMACDHTLGHEEHCLLLLTLVRKEFSGTNSKPRQAGKQKPVKLPTSLYTSFHVRSTDDFSAFFFLILL